MPWKNNMFLDDPKNYQKLDPVDLYNSLSKFGRQLESGWHIAEFVNLDFDTEKIKNIVFAGMGGSNLSAEIIRSLSPFILNMPFETVANYRLPPYADKNTLVILSSHSGNTEEILSCAQDAQMRGCRIVCLTGGGKLRDFANKQNLPLIELDDKFNPARTARSGVFVSIGAVIGLLLRLNPAAKYYFHQKEITDTIERVIDMVSIHKDTPQNPAKSLAMKHKGTGIIILSANHLTGVGVVLRNYLNETAKTFCANFEFPDLNHHLMEGLQYPLSLKDDVHLIILNSGLYPAVIQKRIQITREVLLKQKYRVTVLKPEANDPVLQVFESLAFLIIFSYYLSIVNKVDPATNPWVDYFKKELH